MKKTHGRCFRVLWWSKRVTMLSGKALVTKVPSKRKSAQQTNAAEGSLKGRQKRAKKMANRALKTSLAAPYALQWDAIDDDYGGVLLKRFTECMKSLPELRCDARVFKHKNRPSQKRRRLRKKQGSVAMKPKPEGATEDGNAHNDSPNSAPRRMDDSEYQRRRMLVVGVNAVTKALERNELQAVVVDRMASPAALVQHIPVLCRLKNVPICPCPPGVMSEFQGLLGSNTLLSFGIRRGSLPETLQKFASALKRAAVTPTVPWLCTDPSSVDAHPLHLKQTVLGPPTQANIGKEK